MEEPIYFVINPIYSGFKKPRFSRVWIPIPRRWGGGVDWICDVEPIKTYYSDIRFPKDDIRYYNPLGTIDYE